MSNMQSNAKVTLEVGLCVSANGAGKLRLQIGSHAAAKKIDEVNCVEMALQSVPAEIQLAQTADQVPGSSAETGDQSGIHCSENVQSDKESVEYSYLQIESFSVKQKRKSRGVIPGPKQWVTIPTGATVRTFQKDAALIRARPSKDEAMPSRSCLSKPRVTQQKCVEDSSPRSTQSESSDSTAASQNDRRRVSFCDGTSPSSDVASASGTPLADWIFVDRDICGFSLYEYAPRDIYFQQFASSEHGRQFVEDYVRAERRNQNEQRALMNCQESRELHRQEDNELNRVLALAGVKAGYLSPTSVF